MNKTTLELFDGRGIVPNCKLTLSLYGLNSEVNLRTSTDYSLLCGTSLRYMDALITINS